MRALALLLALAAAPAIAGEAVLSWTNPTTYTDGAALPAQYLRGTRIEYGMCGVDFGTSTLAPAGNTTLTIGGLTSGDWCFRAVALAIGADGAPEVLESTPTNPVSKSVLDAPPDPPSGLTVQGGYAFTVLKQEDRFILVEVGTVPPGTACDSTQEVLGHYVVPRATVTFYGSVQPVVVVSKCG